MPGICGIISKKIPAGDCERAVKTMTATMRHEKFYAAGNFSAPELGIFAGWTALEDSFAAKQVLFNEQKDIALVFAGECFVEPETKDRLRQSGHDFVGNGGDWLVHLYEELGEKFFKTLNGIFAGLLIDWRNGKVFLFNDRFGLERIYWHETPDAFYFASEAKSLLRILPGLRKFDREGVAQFFATGCPLESRTLFRGIQTLPGGARWTFENGSCDREKYFTPEVWEQQPALGADEFEARFQSLFQKILPRYFESDSAIGIALTGGLDTRMIMACRPMTAQKPACYTFTGSTGRTMDDRVAAEVAVACGLEHQLLRLGPDFFSDFAVHADKTVFITDGASGISGAHEIYFHRQARKISNVRLTGNYGGEILRAVSTFKPLNLSAGIFQADFLPAVNHAAAQLEAMKGNRDTFAAFQEIPWNLFGNLAAGRSQINFRTPFLDNELVALAYQRPAPLQKSSMPAVRLIKAASPALDQIPTDRGVVGDRGGAEVFFRRAFAEVTFKLDYCSNAGLPRPFASLDPLFKPVVTALGITGLHKFLKYSSWFRAELSPFVREKISAAKNSATNFLDAAFLDSMTAQHLAGRKNFSAEINAVLTLESIGRQLFRDLPRGQ